MIPIQFLNLKKDIDVFADDPTSFKAEAHIQNAEGFSHLQGSACDFFFVHKCLVFAARVLDLESVLFPPKIQMLSGNQEIVDLEI